MCGGLSLSEFNIRWVLTMPDIFNATAREFMRAVARDSGMEKYDGHVLFAREAEVAVDVRHGASTETRRDVPPARSGELSVVVDSGALTSDVAWHKITRDGVMTEVSASSGGRLGGYTVNLVMTDFFVKHFGKTAMERLNNEPAGVAQVLQ